MWGVWIWPKFSDTCKISIAVVVQVLLLFVVVVVAGKTSFTRRIVPWLTLLHTNILLHVCLLCWTFSFFSFLFDSTAEPSRAENTRVRTRAG